jgi:uncharacterized delta-60 repeat protein
MWRERRINASVSRAAFAFLLLCALPASALNGALDPSFGNGGVVLAPPVGALHGWGGSARALIRQADGKLVVAGVAASTLAELVRLNPDGTRDTAFGAGGQITYMTPSRNTFEGLLQQPDGKLVVVGHAGEGQDLDFLIARYNPDGTPDATFPGSGIQRTAFGPYADRARAVARQSDGKLIVAGVADQTSGSLMALARYNSDGTLDASFDGDGRRTFGLNSSSGLWSVIVQADGKIVAAGYTSNLGVYSFVLVRLLDDGSFDPTFSGDGIATVAVTGASDGARSLIQQADGKLVAVGGTNLDTSNLGNGMHVMRFNLDGTLDTTFDGDGRVQTVIGTNGTSAAAVAQQADGKLVVVGRERSSASDYFAAARYNPDGSLDPTFDGDGKMSTTILGNESRPRAFVIQPDGRMVLAGEARNPTLGFSNALVRLSASGALDTTFDADGALLVDVYRRYATLMSLFRQSDGKIVAVGTIDSGTFVDFLVMRFTADGALDPTFDGDGVAITDVAGKDDTAYAIAQQADGKLVVVGDAWTGTSLTVSHDFAWVRYRVDGSVDLKVTTSLGSNYDEYGRAVVIQSDGRIVIGGMSRGGDTTLQDFTLVRYTAAGALDPTFDGDGVAVTAMNATGNEVVAALLQQPDGKLVLGGSVPVGTDENFALARYSANGALDPTFDGDGKVITGAAGGVEAELTALLRQPDGKLVAAGVTSSGVGDAIAVRYLATGALDPSFDGDGVITTPFGPSINDARAVVGSPDGRLLTAGRMREDNVVNRFLFAAMQYRADGTPDPDFDGDGKAMYRIGAENADVRGVVRQPGGKVVIGGTAYDSAGNQVFALARIESSVCGDAVVNGSDQCDLGALNGTAGACCDAECRFVGPSVVCRAASGICDVEERCTGTDAACPVDVDPACTPTASVTATPSATHTPTDTALPTFTAPPSATASASATATAEPTGTESATVTVTDTQTPTPSATPTLTPLDPTASATATQSATPQDTPTATQTASETPTVTASASPSSTPTNSATEPPAMTASTTPTVTSLPAAPCAPTPRTDCATAGRTILVLSRRGGGRDRLTWKWSRGTAAVGDWGNPLQTTRYAFCLYDERGLLAAATLPLGAPWLATNDGFTYRDTAARADGILRLDLRAGAGAARILLAGRGAGLPDPDLPALPPVVAQLVAGDAGGCWQGAYDVAQRSLRRNLPTRLKGKTP